MSRGKCNWNNAVKYVRGNHFPSDKAAALGYALRTVPRNRIQDAIANHGVHGSFQLALIDIIQYWLDNELHPEWETLAQIFDAEFAAVASRIRGCSGKPSKPGEIMEVLMRSGFAPDAGMSLAPGLGVPRGKLQSIMADRGVTRNTQLALTDILQAWFDNDLDASWEKLEKALDEVDPKQPREEESQEMKEAGEPEDQQDGGFATLLGATSNGNEPDSSASIGGATSNGNETDGSATIGGATSHGNEPDSSASVGDHNKRSFFFYDLEFPKELPSKPHFGIDLDKVHKRGIDGHGVKLAIIDGGNDQYDEGIFVSHRALQIRGSECKIKPEKISCCKDRKNHALMCASVAVGEQFSDAFYINGGRLIRVSYPGGVAPRATATVFLVNAYDKKTMIEALDRVIKGNFDVLSMSFVCHEYDKDVAGKLDELKGKTVIVAAAGNSGNNIDVGFPACHDDVISVGSLDTDFKVSSFSALNKDVDIYFPGEIMAPFIDDKHMLKFSTGTSVATPGIAGIVCLLIQGANHHKSILKQKENVLKLLNQVVITETPGIVYRPKANFLIEAYLNEKYYK